MADFVDYFFSSVVLEKRRKISKHASVDRLRINVF